MNQSWPTFAGKPLVPLPETVPVADLPAGEWGARFLAEYRGRVERDYRGNRSLLVLESDGGVVVGSNYPAVVLANQIVRELGMRVATPADLERIIALRALDLGGKHVHVALVLRSVQMPNSSIARELARQITARGKSLGVPLMIPLAGLQLVNDGCSAVGVSFTLTEEAQIIEAPMLDDEHNHEKFARTDVNGLPSAFQRDAPRTLYTATDGLCGMSIGRTHDLDVYTNEGHLGASDWDGRIVLMREGAQRMSTGTALGAGADADASALQATLASDLNAKYQACQAVLKKRFERAVRVLQGRE
jgi:hypothetical protein